MEHGGILGVERRDGALGLAAGNEGGKHELVLVVPLSIRKPVMDHFDEGRAGAVLRVGQRGDLHRGEHHGVGRGLVALKQTLEVKKIAKLRRTHHALGQAAAVEADGEGFGGGVEPPEPRHHASTHQHCATFAVLAMRRDEEEKHSNG